MYLIFKMSRNVYTLLRVHCACLLENVRMICFFGIAVVISYSFFRQRFLFVKPNQNSLPCVFLMVFPFSFFDHFVVLFTLKLHIHRNENNSCPSNSQYTDRIYCCFFFLLLHQVLNKIKRKKKIIKITPCLFDPFLVRNRAVSMQKWKWNEKN